MILARTDIGRIRPLIERFHGYGSVGDVATEVFAVFEGDQPIAAYVWNPPAPGAAKAIAPAAPQGVLALTRMVAIPRDQRSFHVSKPLRYIMRRHLDRGRWPVLVTYSDASMGHTGHVYKCSGWQKDGEKTAKVFEDDQGARRSCYSAGRVDTYRFHYVGTTILTRWVHRVTPPRYRTRLDERRWMASRAHTRQGVAERCTGLPVGAR